MQNKNTATDVYISNLNIAVVEQLPSKKTGIVKLLIHIHTYTFLTNTHLNLVFKLHFFFLKNLGNCESDKI